MSYKIILIVLITILTSCEKYEQPSTLTLSGAYVIDRIVLNDSSNSVLSSPDIFINNNSTIIDTILLGSTKWAFDNSKFYMKYVNNRWQKTYYYFSYWQTNYDYGYIEIETENGGFVFKILDDGIESLILKTTGQWNNNISDYETLTIYLVRTGP